MAVSKFTNDPQLEAVRKALIEYMEANEVKRYEASEMAGLTKGGLSNFLNGHIGINFTTFLRLLNGLGISFILLPRSAGSLAKAPKEVRDWIAGKDIRGEKV